MKVQSAAIHFFLGVEDEAENDSDDEAEVCHKLPPSYRKHLTSISLPVAKRQSSAASSGDQQEDEKRR